MRTILVLATALSAGPVDSGESGPTGRMTVAHRHLVPVCLGDTAVEPRHRQWPTGTTPITMTFTMRNQPRPGIVDASSGYATVTFTPEAGHRYEVEVRSAPQTFSSRVWPEGRWAPAVRDRTTDVVVSSAPTWGPPPCAPRAPRF